VEKPAGYAVFERTLREWDSDDLLLAASLVSDLRDHPGWEVVEKLIVQRRDWEVGLLLHGAVKSQAEYAERTGRLSGLDSTLRVVEAVVFAADEREHGEQADADRAALQEVA
jgi:hypothetical protein